MGVGVLRPDGVYGGVEVVVVGSARGGEMAWVVAARRTNYPCVLIGV